MLSGLQVKTITSLVYWASYVILVFPASPFHSLATLRLEERRVSWNLLRRGFRAFDCNQCKAQWRFPVHRVHCWSSYSSSLFRTITEIPLLGHVCNTVMQCEGERSLGALQTSCGKAVSGDLQLSRLGKRADQGGRTGMAQCTRVSRDSSRAKQAVI